MDHSHPGFRSHAELPARLGLAIAVFLNFAAFHSADSADVEDLPGPLSAEASREAIVTRPGFDVELVACEPLVRDPIAFEWGGDGKFWVAEMADYPNGIDGQGRPGGRIRFLEDRDGDGRYDASTLFLDGVAFPTGVFPWGRGVLVSAAPEIFYAEDTDGDGRADVRRTLYRGFGEGNQQHRVNGFAYGLDNWLYCANGDSGGTIDSVASGTRIELRHGDLRIHPDTGAIERIAGLTQFGRHRDQWGNWFGSNNSNPQFHFVLDDRYTRRNPHVAPVGGKKDVSTTPGTARCYPASRTLTRFNDFAYANRFTSACGGIVYDDELLGPAFVGNSFVCEPVHNLVHREVVLPDGVTFTSSRAPGEEQAEFLASRDNWFRPTSVKQGPDGALWIADMYRLVIEHPEWIPDDFEARVDVRSGADRGRIYRVFPRGVRPRVAPRLSDLPTTELVAAIDSPFRWQRDTAQRLLIERGDQESIDELEQLLATCDRPAARLQAMCTLAGLDALRPERIRTALDDPHPAVRRHAVRLATAFLNNQPELAALLANMAEDPDPHVRLQLAYTLGEWNDARSGDALGRLATTGDADRYLLAAVISSVSPGNIGAVLAAVRDDHSGTPRENQLLEQLLQTALGYGDRGSLIAVLSAISTFENEAPAAWQYAALADTLESLERSGQSLAELAATDPQFEVTRQRLSRLYESARRIALDADQDVARRRDAVRLLAMSTAEMDSSQPLLLGLLSPQTPAEVQEAAVAGLLRGRSTDSATQLLAAWQSFGPQLRRRVIEAMLEQAGTSALLLDAIQQNTFSANNLDAATRQRLLGHPDDAIRAEAAEVLRQATDSNRQLLVEKYMSQLTGQGDIEQGRKTFGRLCANCHQLENRGTAVGPDLAALSDKSTPALLTAILDPNRAVEAKYHNYIAVTDQGLSFTGILAEETGNSILLRGAEGKEQVILRTHLEQLVTQSQSAMPEGLEKDLAAGELEHVVAYLQSFQGPLPRRSFDGNYPRVGEPAYDGTISLQARVSEVYGETLVYESSFHHVSNWKSQSDQVAWTVRVPDAGTFDVLAEWACPANASGNTFLVEIAGEQLQGEVTHTGSGNAYQQHLVGQLTLPAGEHRLSVRSAGPIDGALFNFRSVTLVPVDTQDAEASE